MKTSLLSHLNWACVALCFILSLPIKAQRSVQADFLSTTEELTSDDVADLEMQTSYTTKEGITYSYYRQHLNGVPIYNAIGMIVRRERDDYVYAKTSFLSSIHEMELTGNDHTMDAERAVRMAMRHENLTGANLVSLPAKRSGTQKFSSPELSSYGATAELVYMPKDGGLVLSWQIDFDPKEGRDYWSMRIDASSGAVVDQSSYTTHCAIQHDHSHSACKNDVALQSASFWTPRDGSSYRVFALPAESPIHGPYVLLNEPADSLASPFGWHDTNGQPGADTRITEGNNAITGPDLDEDFEPDFDVEGGDDLVFDFPVDITQEPQTYTEGATVNLFYLTNMMHDITYHYGFDENAGNFQANNYGRGGANGDPAVTWAQFGGNAGNNINNADFSTPPDGNSGRMRMFLWDRRDDVSVFSVLAPEEVAGTYQARTANFGEPITNANPLEGEVAVVSDNIGIPTDACQTVTNGDEISGKIALIDRGSCEFGRKILNAEQQGAIGVIMCNNEPGILAGQMGAGAVGSQVTIPSVFLSKADCDLLRTFIDDGLQVRFQQPEDDGAVRFIDGTLDNGIIAHEYGHGISNRLTAGPFNTGCLGNSSIGGRDEGEQMGEGWSDFFTIALTVQPGDDGTTGRGIGNFAIRQDPDGGGIRPFPYNTDMNFNPVTYHDIVDASVPHGVGHVWCSMLWDLHWNFVDRHGYDADLINGTAGNNMAIRLVMEGMRLQPCDPGFQDGRDAILEADRLLYGGANQDIIWQTFARRGLGWLADQGSSSILGDGIEDYSLPPEVIKTVKIVKDMTPVINRGESITVSLTVRNDTDDDVTNIELVDPTPTDASVDVSTLPAEAQVVGGDVVFSAFDLQAGDQQTFTYELTTPDIPSVLQYYEGFEDLGTFDWAPDNIEGVSFWQFTDLNAINGSFSYELRNVLDDNEQALVGVVPQTIQAGRPMVRFIHRYAMDAGHDGGVFEVSNDFFGDDINDMGDNMIREGYDANISRNTFSDLTDRGFTSTNSGLRLTYVDLADFIGQDLTFRWRFASDEMAQTQFWTVDDFTLFDARVYNSEACLSYDGQTDNVCAEAPEWGTIVEPAEFVSVDNTDLGAKEFEVFPNPLDNIMHVRWHSADVQRIDIFNTQGQRTASITTLDSDSRELTIPTSSWSAGMYTVSLTLKDEVLNKKVIKP